MMEERECYQGGRRRYQTARARCEVHDDDDDQDDLLFDLEYEECDRRRRSASADSFHNTRSGVQLSVERYEPDHDDDEVTPAVSRVRSFKLRQEEWYGSLPGHHNSRNRYSHIIQNNNSEDII